MSNEIEQIEARLTAYIDGQLPEKDRGEIEAYLAANPTHARLIIELQRQRALLRTLPREAAPAEIMDHVQAHLERHALLTDGDTSSVMKINRWPQFGAVAAMLLLAVGLGVLVYQVLPSGGMKPEQMVLAPPSVQQLPQVPALSNNGAELTGKETGKPSASEPMPMLASAKRMERLAAIEPASHPADAVEPAPDVVPMAKTVAVPTTLPAAPLNHAGAIVVTSDDPALTRSLLATYLAENGLAYEVAQESPVAAAIVAPTTEPAGAMSVASVVDELQLRRALPATLPADAAPARDLIVVRNVRAEQVEAIRQAIDGQREGHQSAQLLDSSELMDRKMMQFQDHIIAPVEPAQNGAAVEAEHLRQASTQPSALAAAEVAGGNAPTTQLTPDAPPPGEDVLIVVMAKPQAAPATHTASSKPTSGPAPLPVPPPKPMPLTGADANPTTQPGSVP